MYRCVLIIALVLSLTAEARAVISDNLICYYKLDEASGNAIDAHGTRTLTESAAIGSTAGKINNARDLESGDGRWFGVSDNTDHSTGDIDFSFGFWVNPESLPGNAAPLGKDNNPTSREYGFYYSSGLRWYVFGPASEFTEVNGGTLSTSTWYYVVVWHDATGNEIGISVNDGTPVTAAHTAGVRDGTAGFAIGAISNNGGNHWDGLVDEVGFWKKKLSAAEITSLYNSGNGLAYKFGETVPGPAALYYRLLSTRLNPLKHPQVRFVR
jgi:hypothetical protein